MLVEALTPSLELGPGESTICRARVTNNSSVAARYAVRLHGLGPVGPYIRLGSEAVEPNTSIDFELPIVVPESFGVGEHGAAIEVRSDQRQEVPVIANFTVGIGTTDHIAAQIVPSVLRTHRRGKFKVEIVNTRTIPTEVELVGSAPNLTVRLDQGHVVLQPGQTVLVTGHTKGRRHIVGEPIAHVVTVETTANSMPSYSMASVQQRAVIPWKLRSGFVGLAILLVWIVIAVVGVLWLSNRNANKTASTPSTPSTLPGGVAADGSTPLTTPGSGATGGSTATAGSAGTGAAGSGTGGAAGGAGGAAGGAAAGGKPAVPTQTVVRGTVKAGSAGADDGVHVTLTPTTPDGPAASTNTAGTATPGSAATGSGPGASMVPVGSLHAGIQRLGLLPADRTQNASANASSNATASHNADASTATATKRWPARYGTYSGTNLDSLRTFTVTSVSSGTDGAFQFSAVPLHRSYELSFSKVGYISKSVIVNPTDDGKPVQMEVQLLPGNGSIDGIVTSNGAGLGGVSVSATDGTVILKSTTSTDAKNRGTWSLDGLSTPGTYTITFAVSGYGTQVAQVVLGAGEKKHGINIAMFAGVGSVSGTIRTGGNPLGGITITASASDKTVSTTSLTEGALGTFEFPQLVIGQSYIITATADGYITQSRSVAVNSNETGVDFDLVSTTGSITGQVFVKLPTGTADALPLVNAGVSVSANGLQVNKPTAAAPDAGAFTVGDLPPGSYLVTVSRYDTTTYSQLVTLVAGQVLDLGQIVLTHQDPPAAASTGSLIVRSLDTLGQPINGATVILSDVGGRRPAITITMGASENSAIFNNIPIGTYNFTVARNTYRPNTIGPVSIGLTQISKDVTLLKFGTARGTVINRVGGTQEIVSLDDRRLPTFKDPATGALFVVSKAEATNPGQYTDTTGAVIVKQSNGTYFRGASQLVAELTETVGNLPAAPILPATVPPVGAPTQQLKNYELLLYSVGKTYGCITPIPVADTATPDPTDPYARLVWQIDPSQQLLPGTYVLRFSPPPSDTGSSCAGHGQLPPGFAAIPIDVDGNAATFTVAANSDARIVVPPIQLAPYPSVTGTVVVPYKAGGVYTYTNFDTTQTGTVSVKLNCPRGLTASAVVAAGGQKVNFTFSTTAIAALFATQPRSGFSLATCTLAASSTLAGPAGGPALKFMPNSTALPLSLGDKTYEDQVVSVALVQDPNDVAGTVVWQDAAFPGSAGQHPVNGIVLSASGTPGFGSGTAPDSDGAGGTTVTAPNPPPKADVGFSPAITNNNFIFSANGNRQVIGTTDYSIKAPNFADSTMTVTANASAVAVPWAASGAGVTQTANLATVLMQPNPGQINGAVVFSNPRAQAHQIPFAGLLSEVAVHATAPGATTSTLVNVDNAGTYTIPNAAAGTWGLDQTVAAGSELMPYSGALPQAPLFVDAAAQTAAAPVSYIVLGKVKVNVEDSTGAAITAAATTITLSRDGSDTTASFPATYATNLQHPDSSGSANFDRLPVGDTNISANPSRSLRYLLSVVVPGYEDAPQGITITDSTGSLTDSSPVSLTNIPLNVFESSNKTVTIVVRKLGVLSGSVIGQLLGTPTRPLNPSHDGLAVVATRADGSSLDGHTYAGVFAQPTDSNYTIALPAGGYTVSFTASNFVQLDIPNVSVTVGASTTRDALMRLQTGELDLSTLMTTKTTPTVSSTSFVAETVGLWDASLADSALTSANQLATFNTDGVTPYNLTGLYPGTYTIKVTTLVVTPDPLLLLPPPAPPDYFPVIGTITVPEGPTSAARTIAKTTLTSIIDGEILGTVTAENSVHEAIAMPAGVKATAVFSGDTIRNTGNTSVVSNRTALPSVSATIGAERSVGSGAPFDIGGLPRGTSTLSFDAAAGFTPPNSQNVLVTGTVTAPGPFKYAAADVTVDVTVVDHSGPSGADVAVPVATVTLTPPAGSTSVTPIPLVATAAGSNVYSAQIPPRLTGYTVTVTATLHQTYTTTQIVSPSATALAVRVVMQQSGAITGTIRTQSSSAPPGTVLPNTALTLTGPGAATTAGSSDANGVYSFPITVAGTYTVSVDTPPTGFGPGTTGPFTVAIGTSTAHDITMLKFSEVDLTIAGAPAAGFTVTASSSTGVTRTLVGSVYQFTGLTPNTPYSFTAVQTGFATQTYVFPAATNTPGLTKSATLTWIDLAGTITNAAPSTVVTLTPPNGPAQTQTFTGSTGSYDFTGLEPGSYTIAAVRAWDTLSMSVTFTLGAGASVTNPNPSSVNPKALALPAVQSATISGRVVDQTGTPLATANVTLKKGTTTISGPTNVGSNGKYTFNAGVTVAGNDYTVVAAASGYVGDTSAAINVTGATAPYAVGDLTLYQLATAAITLSNPPPGITSVSVSPTGPVVSVSGNVYSFTGLVPGTAYTFTAGTTAGDTQTFTTPAAVAAGAYTHTFTWENAVITFVNPPSGASVSLTTGSGPTTASTSSPFTYVGLISGRSYTFTTSGTASQTATVVADGTDNITFTWVSANVTYVNAPAGTANPTVSPTSAITASTATPFTFINLIPGNTYDFSAPGQPTCTIVASVGGPNACTFTWVSATVTYVNAPPGTASPTASASTVTTSSSSSPFTFTGLVAGTSYTFSAPGQASCTITASATSSANSCTFTWTNVAGTVAGLTPSTEPANVVLSGPTSGATAVTAAATGFAFNQLAPGAYTITVTDNSATAKHASISFTVTVGGTTSPLQSSGAWTLTLA